jgi:hypothetical protein
MTMGNRNIRSVRAVLNDLIGTQPPREAVQQASPQRIHQSGSAPLGTVPRRASKEDDGKPLLTSDERRTLEHCLKLYADAQAMLRELEQMILRPGLSDVDAKEVVKLIHRTLSIIAPLTPLVESFNKFSTKQAKVESRCRECVDVLNNLELNLKLDRLHNMLSDALERRSQERSAAKPIDTLDELCKKLVEKN